MVKLGRWVIESHRTVGCCNIVTKHKVAYVILAVASCNRGNCIVRHTVCLGKDIRLGIGISAPCGKDLVTALCKAILINRRKSDNRHRPLNNTCLNGRIALHLKHGLNRRPLHSKGIFSALKMLVRKNRSANDRQIGIRPNEIVRKIVDNIKELAKHCPVYLHRHVAVIEEDAVLVVVAIW